MQAAFLSCPVYEVLYGGQKGGGKTDALLFDHVEQHLTVHKHWEETGMKTRGQALILRKEYGRLADFINRSLTYFPVLSKRMMKWQEQKHTWHCVCGYRVWFGHCEGPQDHQLYQGQEISRLAVDQVEELPYDQYAYIKLQVRPSSPLLEPTIAVRCSANPLGRHADWVKKRFVEKNRAGFDVQWEDIEVEDAYGEKVVIRRDRVFIPAGLRDNPHLPASYIADLMSAPDHMRRAFLDGDWDVTAGSFFGDIFDAKTHVIDDLGPTEKRIPSNWPVFRCADWGPRSPACCLWLAVDNDGMLIVLDELYGPGEEPFRWANKILAIEEKWGWLDSKGFSKLRGYIDPSSTQGDTSGGPTIAEKLFEAGLSWWPGDNDRKNGWAEVRRRLLERGGVGGHTPGLRIARRCTNLIRTLPNLTSPENEMKGDMDDIDTKQEDHAADALRYGVMSRPMAQLEKDIKEDEIKRWERIAAMQQHTAERNYTTGY